MFIPTFGRCGAVVLLLALVSGCSMFGSEPSSRASARSSSSASVLGLGNECNGNRSRCMYEGAYEPGERGYAEEEARRLNQASAARFRRSAGR